MRFTNIIYTKNAIMFGHVNPQNCLILHYAAQKDVICREKKNIWTTLFSKFRLLVRLYALWEN